MNIWGVIPVKPLKRAKSRLASVLSQDQRTAFAELMYRQVMDVVTKVSELNGIVVISRDTKALAIARDYGVKTIQESSPSDLNPALHRATEMTRLWRADAVMILPVDLPFLTAQDIISMIEMAKDDPCVVIATDREKDGTNAMLVRPPSLFEYSYGDGSFVRHVASAREKKASVKIYQSETISLDIDVPADLHTYNQMVHQGIYDASLVPFLPNMAG